MVRPHLNRPGSRVVGKTALPRCFKQDNGTGHCCVSDSVAPAIGIENSVGRDGFGRFSPTMRLIAHD